MVMDETDPRYIAIDKRLHAVITELDDDFLQRIVAAEWGENNKESHWYDATLQMMYAIVASMGTPVEEFFADWVVEPHNSYLLREYKRRQALGAYNGSVEKFDGMNKSFDRGAHYSD